ncbi:MAG: transglutaminase-like domain-containing protein [Lentisphaerales bacterium]|nr:transglutaminase-like domain-containing protein [Lentisphaerales bacterium]
MTERQKMVFFRCWAFMVPAMFFSFVTDTMHMAILGMLISLIVIARKQPIAITPRSVIYSIVIAFTVVTLFNAFVKIENRFHLTPSELGVPAMLVLSMAATFFDDKPTITSLTLILSIFAIMMSGDINEGHEVITLPIPASLGDLENIKFVYLISIFLCIPPFYFLMNRSQNKLKVTKLPSLKWSFLKYILIALCLFGTFLFYKPTVTNLVPMSRQLESSIVRWASQFRMQRQTQAFNEKITLKHSYMSKNLDLDTVFIRVKSSEIPGYLRSRSYEFYHTGDWVSDTKPSTMPLLTEDHEYTHSTFSFQGYPQPDKNSLKKMDIYYSSDFKVNTLLHRGSSNYLELKCDGLEQTSDGTVSGKGLDFSGGLTIYNTQSSKGDDAFPGPELTSKNLATYLQVPSSNMRADLIERFKFISSQDPNIVAKEIVKFFPSNGFKYSLNAKLDYKLDPVYAFLEKKEGHCELYATTSIMILRSKGIPARYVTGFYCQEEHPSGSYFVGRSMDLHAWVEYYDSQSQSWKLMEPTPPANLPQGKPKFNSFSAIWDNLAGRWQEMIAKIVRGFFAESIILFLGSVFDFFFWFTNTPIKATFSLITLIFILWWRKFKRNKAIKDPEFYAVNQEFSKILRKLSKLEGFSKKPCTTLREMIKFLENRADEISLKYASCLKEYELLRYDKNRRSPDTLKEIQKKLRVLSKTRIR